jgi:hypothetical protein
LQKSSSVENAGESACATKLDQQFAEAVGQAFSLPDCCHGLWYY